MKYKIFYDYAQHQGETFTLWLGTFFNEYIKDSNEGRVPFIPWPRYKAVVFCFFELLFRDILHRNRLILLPYSLGFFYITKVKTRIPEKAKRFGVDNLFNLIPKKGETVDVPEKMIARETNFEYFKFVYRPGTMRNATRYYKFIKNRSRGREIWRHVLETIRDPHAPNYKSL